MLRGHARRLEARRPQRLVGDRLQPPEPRQRRSATGCSSKIEAHVPQRRLAGGDAEVRHASSRRRFRRPGGEALARMDRRLPELRFTPLSSSRAAPRWRERLAARSRPASPASRRCSTSTTTPRCARADDQPRRSRPADRARCLPRARPTTGRPASSPTPSRAMVCPSPATRITTPGLMTEEQMDRFRADERDRRRRRVGSLRRPRPTGRRSSNAFSRTCRSPQAGADGIGRRACRCRRRCRCPPAERMSTQEGFGRLLAEMARAGGSLADRIVTTSPDVTVSTNLGGWVNRAASSTASGATTCSRRSSVLSAQRWAMSPEGPARRARHRREQSVHPARRARAGAVDLFGARLIPIGTLYDPFIQRGLDALNYACYQDARFILVATPSGHHAGAGGRRAPVDRHAADRHGAGRARRVRAGIRRRAGGDPAPGRSTICSATASRRTRPGCARPTAARSICDSRRARSTSRRAMIDDAARGDHRRRLLAAPPGRRGARHRLPGRGRAGGARRARPDPRGHVRTPGCSRSLPPTGSTPAGRRRSGRAQRGRRASTAARRAPARAARRRCRRWSP